MDFIVQTQELSQKFKQVNGQTQATGKLLNDMSKAEKENECSKIVVYKLKKKKLKYIPTRNSWAIHKTRQLQRQMDSAGEIGKV